MKPFVKAKRQWANLANPFGNKEFRLRVPDTQGKNGQALVELTVLGTVLIFAFTLLLRYGMSANYQELVSMQGFRKAFVRASQYDPAAKYNRGEYDPANANWTYENARPPVPSNHWRTVNYTVIEDKPILSAGGILPIVERVPIAAATEAVLSIDMFGEMEYGNERDLPRVEFEINGKRYSFTTAAFREYPENSQMRKKEDIEDWMGLGPSWEWKTVSTAKKGDVVDVDGDGEEENVLEAEDGILKVLDYQEGEINLSAEEEGALQGYDKQARIGNSSFSRQENETGISSAENINSQEIFTRTIKTRDGDYDVVDTFSTQKQEIWSTPHK